MPSISDIPKAIKPYVCHGLDLKWGNGSEEAIGQCPFCLKNKFYVSIASGLYSCKTCGTGTGKGGGNATVFLRKLHEESEKATTEYSDLMESRKLLLDETLMLWGVARSVSSGDWLVPGYGVSGDGKGKICQLYRYRQQGSKWILAATSEIGHALHGVNLYDAKKPKVFVCEGPWDAMALHEVLKSCRYDDEQLVFSGESSSLYSEYSILAVPGCNVWQDHWASLLAGKDVTLLYDSDHPDKSGRSAGWEGMRRVCEALALRSDAPNSVSVIKWGPEGYDPALKSGYDIRDLLTDCPEGLSNRFINLQNLLGMIEPMPSDWVKGRSKLSKANGKVEIEPLQCEDWKTLRQAWLKAMNWTDNLEYGLTMMLAAACSVDIPGDKTWLKVISPASSGKTTLLEGLAVAKKRVLSKDTLTGISSGYQTDADGSKNLSLVIQMNGKAFVIKDGDTLLQNPAKEKILSQLRALYDGAFRTSFGNEMSADHENLSVVVIICGTSSLRQLDTSELGARMIDVVMMDGIDEELEDDVLDRVLGRVFDKAEEDEKDHEETMAIARRMTGGFVEHLRYVMPGKWDGVSVDSVARNSIKHYALLTAHMRARPSTFSTEVAEREFASRLAEQFARQSKCLAIVLGKGSVDAEVLARIRRSAMDTARGDTMTICTMLHQNHVAGMNTSMIAKESAIGNQKVGVLLSFLRKIKVVESFDYIPPISTGIKGGAQKRWRLTTRLQKLYDAVSKEIG